MEVLGNAPSSHQPTFCNLARCRRPWPQRRGGACRSMQQQDRAIRAGGAPVRGKSERRADGAAIDWRTARSSNRRRPRSNAPSSRRKRHSRRPWRAPSVSINKEIELGVRGRWPPLSECTICSDPASRSSSCREVGCAALQTIRREYAARPHGSVPSTNLTASGFCTDDGGLSQGGGRRLLSSVPSSPDLVYLLLRFGLTANSHRRKRPNRSVYDGSVAGQ